MRLWFTFGTIHLKRPWARISQLLAMLTCFIAINYLSVDWVAWLQLCIRCFLPSTFVNHVRWPHQRNISAKHENNAQLVDLRQNNGPRQQNRTNSHSTNQNFLPAHWIPQTPKATAPKLTWKMSSSQVNYICFLSRFVFDIN